GRRRLQPGRHPLRAAHRPGAVPGQRGPGNGAGAVARAAAAVVAAARPRPAPGGGLPEGDGQEAGPALREHEGVRRRPGRLAGGRPLAGGGADAGGFRPLFNGKDLSGWKVRSGPVGAWGVDGGELVARGGRPFGQLVTVSRFKDYVLSLDFRLPAAGNSGVFLWLPSGRSLEVNILDDTRRTEGDAKLGQRTGALLW